MIIKSISNKNRYELLKTLPVISLDAGFSAKSKSCGLAWRTGEKSGSEEVTHQVAIHRLIGWIKQDRESVIIIEAPLSTAYLNGNPARRGDFEIQKVGDVTKTRVWYSGPGAAVTLAALNILRILRMDESLIDCTVHLLEGFVSFGDSRTHQEVAIGLRNAFIDDVGTWYQVDLELETLTVATLAGFDRAEEPPAILVPPLL